jgi:hypothetical protein
MPFKKTFGEDGSVMVVGIQSPDIFKKEVYNQVGTAYPTKSKN